VFRCRDVRPLIVLTCLSSSLREAICRSPWHWLLPSFSWERATTRTPNLFRLIPVLRPPKYAILVPSILLPPLRTSVIRVQSTHPRGPLKFRARARSAQPVPQGSRQLPLDSGPPPRRGTHRLRNRSGRHRETSEIPNLRPLLPQHLSNRTAVPVKRLDLVKMNSSNNGTRLRSGR
jgi:hypothetical protein